jgi:hypothetical protein
MTHPGNVGLFGDRIVLVSISVKSVLTHLWCRVYGSLNSGSGSRREQLCECPVAADITAPLLPNTLDVALIRLDQLLPEPSVNENKIPVTIRIRV